MRLVHGIVGATITMLGARSVETTTARSELTFSPALATAGARISVRYRPSGTLAGERSLVLRARFRPADAEQVVPARIAPVATLRRASDGSFTGSFVFPDSMVFGAFAVEDSLGQRVDANGGKKWQLLTRTPKGQPAYASLIQSAYEYYGFWGLALESNRRATTLYPDSIRGWGTLRFHENVALGTSGFEVDSLAAWHRKHFAALHERYANRTPLSPELIADLFDYGSYLKDSTITRFWKARLMSEAPATRTAAQQRGVATLTQLYRDHDTTAALAAFERYWPEAKGTHSQLPGWALQVAASTTDTIVVDRWVERLRGEGASESSIVQSLRGMPARREQALAIERNILARYEHMDDATRPLDKTVNDWAKQRLQSQGNVMGALGRLLVSMGRTDAAIDTLARATSRMTSPELFGVLGDLRLKKGDTTGAARDFAMIAADPGASQRARDSLSARLGWVSSDPRWLAEQDGAMKRMTPLILADAVNFAPPVSSVNDASGKRYPMSSLVTGTPVVLVFWATNCGPCVGEIPSLLNLKPALEAKGVKLVSVTIDDVPSPAMAKFIETRQITYPVYYDVRHEASNAFGVVGIPTVFILDGTGRVRYAHSELSQVPLQLETLR